MYFFFKQWFLLVNQNFFFSTNKCIKTFNSLQNWMLAALDIPLCQDLQPLLYIDTLNLRVSEISKYYLSIKHKFYKQKLPKPDMKPFEQKSSESCIIPVWWQSQVLICCCSPEGAGKEHDPCLGLSGVLPFFTGASLPSVGPVWHCTQEKGVLRTRWRNSAGSLALPRAACSWSGIN